MCMLELSLIILYGYRKHLSFKLGAPFSFSYNKILERDTI